MAQPIFAHLLPPLDFCPSSWVRRDLVLEPEPKPVQISAVNGEPVRRLGFDMILIRKNKKVARHSRLSKRGMAADHRQILVLGSLKQQGKSTTLREWKRVVSVKKVYGGVNHWSRRLIKKKSKTKIKN